jgi:hypothetical protein
MVGGLRRLLVHSFACLMDTPGRQCWPACMGHPFVRVLQFYCAHVYSGHNREQNLGEFNGLMDASMLL